MNLSAAKERVKSEQSLIGSFIDDGEVTHIVIVPTEKDLLDEIIQCVITGSGYEFLLVGFNHFEIYVLFDIDDTNNGYHSHLPLVTALGRLSNND